MHDDFTLSRFRHINHSLDDIVGILVLHHGVQGAVGAIFLAAHLVYQQSSLCARGVDHTLLHNITEDDTKKMLQKSQKGLDSSFLWLLLTSKPKSFVVCVMR